ncbi:hypothetical protein AYK86_10545 [Acinetobacter venetianus]|nr:hypothetical protein AYK86_10545 [Acinetobacter venetianus]
MNKMFDEHLEKLHDSRLYGFLLDWDSKLCKLNVLLYIHIFSEFNFELETYSLEKALVVFENASIDRFSIINDLSSGQFYINKYSVVDLGSGKYQFIFDFDSSIPELAITAENILIKSSGFIKEEDKQFLSTNWLKLFE